jgi:GTPase SAR1 family protein
MANRDGKVIFLGSAGVGKTSIIESYVKGVFPEVTQATIGGGYLSKIVNFHDTTLRLQVRVLQML